MKLMTFLALASLTTLGVAVTVPKTHGNDLQKLLVTQGTLSAEERNGLLLMREEEKLARDVYSALADKWGPRPFSNIVSSEESHMAAMKKLLDTYSISDPVGSNAPGKFVNKDLQKLYDQLMRTGLKSRMDALKVGATIEDLDIFDLEKLLQRTRQSDIRVVYQQLARGSRNHLRSFYRNIVNSGGTYKAQYVDQSEFEKIVNSPTERGGG